MNIWYTGKLPFNDKQGKYIQYNTIQNLLVTGAKKKVEGNSQPQTEAQGKDKKNQVAMNGGLSKRYVLRHPLNVSRCRTVIGFEKGVGLVESRRKSG